MIRKKKLSQYLRMDTGARLLRSILSQPKLGLVLIDLDGTIMFANSNIMSMIGSDKSMRNLSMFKFLLPQDTVMITELVSELLHNTSDVYPTYKPIFKPLKQNVWVSTQMPECSSVSN
jgi:PAS domain-containing protein